MDSAENANHQNIEPNLDHSSHSQPGSETCSSKAVPNSEVTPPFKPPNVTPKPLRSRGAKKKYVRTGPASSSLKRGEREAELSDDSGELTSRPHKISQTRHTKIRARCHVREEIGQDGTTNVTRAADFSMEKQRTPSASRESTPELNTDDEELVTKCIQPDQLSQLLKDDPLYEGDTQSSTNSKPSEGIDFD